MFLFALKDMPLLGTSDSGITLEIIPGAEDSLEHLTSSRDNM